MDYITISAIGLGLALGSIVIFIDNGFDRLLNAILGFFGLSSSSVPLSCHGTQRQGVLEVEIHNQGKTKASIVSALIKTDQGQEIYPIPFTTEEDALSGIHETQEKALRKQLLSDKIHPATSKALYLSLGELEGCNLDSLAIMDMHGNSWPVSRRP